MTGHERAPTARVPPGRQPQIREGPVDYYLDRSAVITGAGSGIGRSLALELAARGARLLLSDRDGDAVADTARHCRAAGVQVRADALDVSDRSAVLDYADSAGTVDITFSVAGVIHTGTVADSTFADIERVIDVNFWGVVNTTKAFLPHLTRARPAHVVNVSSALGIVALPRYSAYSASKFAVRGFTESLRQEMAAEGRVLVTGVYPGGVRTAIMRRGSFAAGEDTAAVVEGFDRLVARTTPEAAATQILAGVRRGRAAVLVGADAHVASAAARALGAALPTVAPTVSRLVRLVHRRGR